MRFLPLAGGILPSRDASLRGHVLLAKLHAQRRGRVHRMKLARLAVALVLAVPLGCKSKGAPTETPGGENPGGTTEGGDPGSNAGQAAEAYDSAVKAEQGGEFVRARDGFLKAKSFVPDFKDSDAHLKSLEDVLTAIQRLDAVPAGDARRAEVEVEYAEALRNR